MTLKTLLNSSAGTKMKFILNHLIKKFVFDKYLKMKLKNPEIKRVYEREKLKTTVMARKKTIVFSLSRIEIGNQNITLLLLYRILAGMGSKPHTVNKDNSHAIAL